MRIPVLAANWKQHKTEAEAISLVRKLMRATWDLAGAEVIICPPYTSLSQLHKLMISSPLQLGAQNISVYPEGAYTGEVSGRMLGEFCSHVIVGHSERRNLYQETDSIIHQKVIQSLQAGLIPILCVGENLEARESNRAPAVVEEQLFKALRGVPLLSAERLLIAYEPVWAIGTGESAAPEDAEKIIQGVIRPVLHTLGGKDLSSKTRVLYGGSVNPGNARGFFSVEEIDGALVGGASLSADPFLDILNQSVR